MGKAGARGMCRLSLCKGNVIWFVLEIQQDMDKLKIGLTFSGGGYRAACFHLGTLFYLDSIKMGGQRTFLDCVTALSTVSGGTITGLCYMLGISRGEPVDGISRRLYDFLLNTDLVTSALDNLSRYEKNSYPSLIRTMSGIYDKELFEGAVLGNLMDKLEEVPVSHFSVNATDFTHGLPFRFQITRKIRSAAGTPYEYGLIGNEEMQLSRKLACHIRLSDILACSSCFPGGFEPMVFPGDFTWEKTPEINSFLQKVDSLGIMDGGIVDNQGIEPVLLAEEQMKRDSPEKRDKCLDLFIVSDVSSPYMNAYQASAFKLPKLIRGLSLNSISNFLGKMEIATAVLFMGSLFCSVRYASDVSFILLMFSSIIWGICSLAKKYVINVAKKSIVKHSVSSLLNLRLCDLFTLMANRISSVLMLTETVFMKHIRRLEYARIYRDKKWMNRRITNTVYELRENERWADKIALGKLSLDLAPSVAMQENSSKAAAMGTTLWFTDDDKRKGIPEALIAAGQYTICWNLLEYIDNIKKYPDNLNENHLLILACETQLKEDWERFKKNPLFKLSFLKLAER